MTDSAAKLPLLILCGPTACGKTRLAVELARHLPIEVISADSRQVYRWMDIGTAKATVAERSAVAHHLIDIVDPDEPFTVAEFVTLGHAAIRRVHARGRLPVLVGGTGLYVQALTNGLVDAPSEDPQLRAQLLAEEEQNGAGTLHRSLTEIDPSLAQRLSSRDLGRIVRALEVFHLTGERLSSLQEQQACQEPCYGTLTIGVATEREALYTRIDRRTESMFAEGLLVEAQHLMARGFPLESKALRTIGYREAISHFQGELSLAAAIELTQRESRRYAKRQLTWFRKNNSIIWLDSISEFGKILKLAERLHME